MANLFEKVEKTLRALRGSLYYVEHMRERDDSPSIGGFEELVLLAVLRLRDEAYGMPIRQLLAEATGKPMSIGAVYTTLERLKGKGLVEDRQGEPTKERGGRAKRYFRVTGAGEAALDRARSARTSIAGAARLEAWA